MRPYYILLNGQKSGPYEEDILKKARLSYGVKIKQSDGEDWKFIETFSELKDSLVPQHKVDVPNDLFNAEFYYKDSEQIYGPFSLPELSMINFHKNSLISYDRVNTWGELGAIPGLYDKVIQIKDLISQATITKKIYSSISQKLEDVVRQYGMALNSLNSFVDSINQEYQSAPKDEVSGIAQVVNGIIGMFNDKYQSVFSNYYETADNDSMIWNTLQQLDQDTSSPIMCFGKKTLRFSVLGNDFDVTKFEFAKLLGINNIIATYDKNSKIACESFLTTILSRMFIAAAPHMFHVVNVDTIDFTGISQQYGGLDKEDYCVFDSESAAQKAIEELRNTMIKRIQTSLAKYQNIEAYNSANTDKLDYKLLILKAFPKGLSPTALQNLAQILRTGLKAGIFVMIVIDQDEIGFDDYAKKNLDSFKMDQFASTLIALDFVKNKFDFDGAVHENDFSFINLSFSQIQEIVEHEDKSAKEDGVDLDWHHYFPKKEKWWSQSSINHMIIPFGISSNRGRLESLKLTQQDAQNSAVVIGLPGSGKSVFLHTIIISACLNYSPDELDLFLIDFSGVEFNVYALHGLPHARIIGPEAEREFGLSVLRQLREEGEIRAAKCRDNGVSNIVDLKTKCPDMIIPRQLAIIDEFQKLFEIPNDAISREAASIIHVIVKEYRKFGINLILATQRLSDIGSSILPKDLVGNRVVFKCSQPDAGFVGLSASPDLQVGECIYNDASGTPSSNVQTRQFYIEPSDREKLLDEITEFSDSHMFKKKDTIIFRSAELPKFSVKDQIKRTEIPDQVDIYFGQPIAISDTDVHATLTQNSNDNILIIGGEPAIAQYIAVNSIRSLFLPYTPQSAKFYFFNFMRQNDPLNDALLKYNNPGIPFDNVFATKSSEVVAALEEIKAEMDARNGNEDLPQNHIFITVFALQLSQVFKKVAGKYGESASPASSMFADIIKNGPLVGIFTILQVDNVQNLSDICEPTLFAHRVVLQMSEKDSNKVLGNEFAGNLYDPLRPCSRYRAYYSNTQLNVFDKFKPYIL